MKDRASAVIHPLGSDHALSHGDGRVIEVRKPGRPDAEQALDALQMPDGIFADGSPRLVVPRPQLQAHLDGAGKITHACCGTGDFWPSTRS